MLVSPLQHAIGRSGWIVGNSDRAGAAVDLGVRPTNSTAHPIGKNRVDLRWQEDPQASGTKISVRNPSGGASPNEVR